MSDMLSLVVFDVDGTLIDSQKHIHASMGAAFAALRLDAPDIASVRNIVGLSLPVAIARLAPDGAPVDELVEAYKNAYTGNPSPDLSPLYEGAMGCLDRLSSTEGVLLGIATGKGRRGLDLMMELHGLQGRFQTVQHADANPSKPSPEMLFKALSETGMGADRSVMIGDTSYDMEMGRHAGMQAWGVAWGYHDVDTLHKAGAHRIFDSFAELEAQLLEWHGLTGLGLDELGPEGITQ